QSGRQLIGVLGAVRFFVEVEHLIIDDKPLKQIIAEDKLLTRAPVGPQRPRACPGPEHAGPSPRPGLGLRQSGSRRDRPVQRIQVVPKTISVNGRGPSRLDLRTLRRFTWTCRDALEQFDKLRSVFDAATYTGDYFQKPGPVLGLFPTRPSARRRRSAGQPV